MNIGTISRRRLTLGAAALLAAPIARPLANVHAQTPAPKPTAPETFDSLVEWLSGKMEELNVPGAAIGVVNGDQRLTRGIGLANTSSAAEFTPSTPFGIASLTKIFTATALSSLANDGALDLDSLVRNHLPEFSVADPIATKYVTVGNLLSHAGGWADLLEPVPGEDDLGWYASQMGDVPQVAPVGTQFNYSNSGFLVLGAIIEQLVNDRYESNIAESVLQPLGMTNSEFANTAAKSSSRAIGHQIVDGKQTEIPLADVPRAINPAAGLISTLDDMLNFVQVHAGIDPRQLDPALLAPMRTPRNTGGSLGPVVVDHIGTGWMLLDIAGETVLMSQGGDSGLISAMVAVPGRQFGMVVLANSDSAMMLVNDAVMRGLADFVELSIPEPEPYVLTAEESARATGEFWFPEWIALAVAPNQDSLRITATTIDGDEIPDFSGQYTMTSANRAFLPYLGGRLWIDLVPDDFGDIQWMRFAARLLPRLS
jgi:CubicO group peptidase (beta-lactamase class C family)